MADYNLKNLTLLIAEDEYLMAMDLATELERVGATVIGPAGTLSRTLRLIEDAPVLDAATLDINLRGEMIYPAADELRTRQIPFVFTTGYDASAIPDRFRDIVICEKPTGPANILRVLCRVVGRT